MKIKLRKILNCVLLLLVIGFLIAYLRTIEVAKLREVRLVSAQFLFIAIMLSFASRVMLPYVWTELLYHFDTPRMWRGLVFRIYARSWMCRYIPGKVAWIGAKITMSVEHGIAKTNAVISSFLEAFIQVFATLVVGLAFTPLFFANRTNLNVFFSVAYLLGFAMLVFLHPTVFNALSGWVYQKSRGCKLPANYRLTFSSLFRSSFFAIISRMLSGASVAFVAFAFVPGMESPVVFFSMVGIASLAAAVGMAALFAPGGIGVNESVQLLLLSDIIDKEPALVVVGLWRLMTVLSDLIYYVVFDIIVPAIFKGSLK